LSSGDVLGGDRGRGYGVDATERIGDDVVGAADVSYVGGELSDESEMVQLPGGKRVFALLESKAERFMIHEDGTSVSL